MNDGKNSTIGMLKIAGSIFLDIALILAYFKVFGLFFIIAPDKSSLILFVLIFGLIIFNGAIIFPSKLSKSIGTPYSASITTLFILYAIIANVISIFLIPRNIIWYIVWELIVLAVFIIIFSVAAAFSKSAAEDILKGEKEQNHRTLMTLQLMEIDVAFAAHKNQEAILPSLKLYNGLKERILASTPFGRITGNSTVLEIENQIKKNLIRLKEELQQNLAERNFMELQIVIEDTRRLVINRETLNIK